MASITAAIMAAALILLIVAGRRSACARWMTITALIAAALIKAAAVILICAVAVAIAFVAASAAPVKAPELIALIEEALVAIIVAPIRVEVEENYGGTAIAEIVVRAPRPAAIIKVDHVAIDPAALIAVAAPLHVAPIVAVEAAAHFDPRAAPQERDAWKTLIRSGARKGTRGDEPGIGLSRKRRGYPSSGECKSGNKQAHGSAPRELI